MNVSSSVLVVVDVQRGFVRPTSEHVVPIIADLVDRWQRGGAATVFTRFANGPGSPYERLIGWTEMQPGSSDVELAPELSALADRATAVLDKETYTAFAPEFARLVRRHGWTDLLLCGIATESCVCKTAVDAFERGDLTPWVVQDACASHAGQEAHEAGLLVTRRFIGRRQIITTADVSAALPSATARSV